MKLAHARGMELHAWVWVFAAANSAHNRILNQPLDYQGPVLSDNPDWAIVTQDEAHPKTFFDPAHPEVRHYLLRLLAEIATEYAVDGIHLDYIRYPFQHPDFTTHNGMSRKQFLAQTGIDPQRITRDNHWAWSRWQNFRTQQIDTFVSEVSTRLRSQRPDLILSAAVFPHVRGERLAKIQQNWESWAQEGMVDLIFLMSYVEETSVLEKVTQPWLELSTNRSSFIIPGIRILDLPNAVTLEQIQLLREAASGGYGLFATHHLNPDLLTQLETIQGGTTADSPPIPYRHPLESAALIYQALRQEWLGLVTEGQLVIDTAQLPTWKRHVETLEVALTQLAQQPSSRHFMTTKVQLAGARSRLRLGFVNHAQQYPEQVAAWENQLAFVDQLVRYGEKRYQLRGRANR